MPTFQTHARQDAPATIASACRRGLRLAVSGLAAAVALVASVQPAAAFSLVGIDKQIINATGQPTPTGPYQVQLTCNPGSASGTVSLTSPNGLHQIKTVPAGTSCSFVELQPPAPPKGCKWTVSYPKGQHVDAGVSGKVVNTLTCNGGGEQKFVVTKQIINNTGLPTPAGPYQIEVNCTPGGPNTTVSLTSPNNLQQTISVPSGSSCTLHEISAPVPRKDCKWVTTYPTSDVRIDSAIHRTVVNELKCDGGGSNITVVKRIINNSGLPTPAGPYQMQVNCSPNGPSTTIGLTSPNHLQQTISVPAGSVCSIVEIPPPPRKDCKWYVSYPDGERTRAGGTEVVVNELKCDGKPGSPLVVSKRIVNNSPVAAPAGPYQVQVNCSPYGPNTTVSLTSPNNLQQTLSVPSGSVCSIVELPPPPSPLANCRWSVSYPNGQTGLTGGAAGVVNTLTCSAPPSARRPGA